LSAIFTSRTRSRVLLDMALPALTVVFGLQTLRVLLPLVVNNYGVRPGVTTISVGIYGFAVFLSAFLTAALYRFLGRRAMLILTAGGLGILRLALQFSPLPCLSLKLATEGAVFFIFFLPTYLARARARGAEGTGDYALAILLGLALDTAIYGAARTYDLAWQRGAGPAIVTVLLVLVQLAALTRASRRSEAHEHTDVPMGSALPFMAMGPLLFLEGQILQNLAQVTARSGWSQPLAFGWIMLSNLAAVALATLLIAEHRWQRWPVALLCGLGLLVATWPPSATGWVVPLGILLGQIGAALLLALVLLAQGHRVERKGLWRTTVAYGLGMFLLVVFIFGYYSAYDLSLPYDNAILVPVAALVATLCALGASLKAPSEQPSARNWAPMWSAAAFLLLPLIAWATWSAPGPIRGPSHPRATASGWPLRIMTYNLHQGFSTEGYLGMEALARVIDGTGADVVANQEVSRGWYINSSLDMLPWLSRRLDMPWLFGPAADPIWGNAILSRYPVLEHGRGMLPQGQGVMKRGYLWARLDMGNGDDLLVIATHLHHIETDHQTHLLQVKALLDFWGGRERTIILGDMNSWPDSPEMELFRQAGLKDAFAEIGHGDGYTFASNDLYERIDYLWLTPDLKASELMIPESTASDHLGVAITVGR